MLTVDVVISPDLHPPVTFDVIRGSVLINASWSCSAMQLTAVTGTRLSLVIDIWPLISDVAIIYAKADVRLLLILKTSISVLPD